MGKQYAERDIESLDEAGGFYSRHVSAMTSEGLHTKSSIAAELGYRDMVNSELLEALRRMLRAGQKQNWNERYESEMSLARAAIAKATGETK